MRIILRGLKKNKYVKPFVLSNKVKVQTMQKTPENYNLGISQGDNSGK